MFGTWNTARRSLSTLRFHPWLFAVSQTEILGCHDERGGKENRFSCLRFTLRLLRKKRRFRAHLQEWQATWWARNREGGDIVTAS